MKSYKVDENTILKFEEGVLQSFKRYCQKNGMNENGGILLGKIKSDYKEYIITTISEPCDKDKSGKNYFVRNKENAQNVIDHYWEASGGEVMYLGEWHTHHEIHPHPSLVDETLMYQCVREIKNLPPYIFMVIVGENGLLYVGTKRIDDNNKLVRLIEL